MSRAHGMRAIVSEVICFPSLRRLIVASLAGALATVAVAWACAIWSPARWQINPAAHPESAIEKVDPDGNPGFQWENFAFGWSSMSDCGQPIHDRRGTSWLYPGPYGGVCHQIAGWPFKALRSRVGVLDSQAGRSFMEGDPEPPALIVRRRWQLPVNEIVHRGIATKDLPGWMHAQADRRLSIVPICAGFMVDSLLYALAFLPLTALLKAIRRKMRGDVRGFPIAPSN